MSKTSFVALGLALLLLGCKGRRSEEKSEEPDRGAGDRAQPRIAAISDPEEEPGSRKKDDAKKRKRLARPAEMARSSPMQEEPVEADEAMAGAPADQPSELGAPTRAWFPETFLFEPLVVTGDEGAAEVEVRVPDRLTTWRVLALAHSRSGAQAGAVTSFAGTLPTYVDPVLPPFLRAGDRVRIPVQLVNTTARPVTAALVLEAAGGTLEGGQGPALVPAGGAVVKYATLIAPRPGPLRFRARLGEADAVLRALEVLPIGKPSSEVRSGTLAAPRSFEMVAATGVDPTLDHVRLVVFPGPLALLRSELAAARGRGSVADDAFGLLLAGKAPDLLRAFGDEADDDALRELAIVLTQRVVRHARVLDMNTATLLAEAALAHPQNPVLANIGRRAVGYIADHQLPDGTCGGETGWTLQRLLVATADCARAANSERRVVIRASGAFERHGREIDDPYTAAAVLAAGGVSGQLEEGLRETVRAAIEAREDGSREVVVPGGVVRSDGQRPSAVEATALAVLALEGDTKAPLADLGAAILAGYSPSRGWGDGRANLVCMQAVQQLFQEPVPPDTRVLLTMDGAEVLQGTLSRDRIREVMVLEAESIGAAGSHQWEVSSEPPVPGLGFALSVTTWGPWPPEREQGGVELRLEPPTRSSVGRPATISVRAAAPAGRALTIRLSLPAGVQPDTGALDTLVGDRLDHYESSDGMIELHAAPLEPAEVFSAEIRVIPTLAGRLQTGASSLEVSPVEVFVPPTTWTIK